jgi:hypothetical protein
MADAKASASVSDSRSFNSSRRRDFGLSRMGKNLGAVGLPGAASVGPKTVSGYGDCAEPACADLARACDDVIRSGCGGAFISDGSIPDPGSQAHTDALLACVSLSRVDLEESAEPRGVTAGGTTAEVEGESARFSIVAAEAARCTRRARSCQQRFDCLRGRMIPPRLPLALDAGVQEATPPTPTPEWTKPYHAEEPDLSLSPPGWADDAGRYELELIPGVDSYACARCAVNRCPGFAYRCFAADGDPTACPNGDCCQSFRRCVRKCGGYSPEASPGMFYACVAECEAGRPHAAQQLADLQGCAAVACAGCERLDQPQTVGGDGGLAPATAAALADGGP